MTEERAKPPQLVWASPVFSPTGRANAARQSLRALAQREICTHLIPTQEAFAFTPSKNDLSWYARMISTPLEPEGMAILHAPPQWDTKGYDALKNLRSTIPGMRAYAAATSFDTDRIPQNWVESLRVLDQVWVPSEHHARAFHNSGIAKNKIRVLPQAIDLSLYDARAHARQETNYRPGFHFLALSSGDPSDGWDLLLEAYTQEFASGDPVTLTFHASASSPSEAKSASSLRAKIEAFVRSRIDKRMADIPPVYIHEATFCEEDWIRYLLAHDALVAPRRGFRWGQALLEAMSLEIPVAATCWGAPAEFLSRENGFPIEIEGLELVSWEQISRTPERAGHRWAKPSIASLRANLRAMKEDAEGRNSRTAKARETVRERFSLEACAKRIEAAARELHTSTPSSPQAPRSSPISPKDDQKGATAPLRLAIRGGSTTSMGHGRVDFEWARRLSQCPEILLVEESESPEILISHDDPPSLLPPPPGCRWIWAAPWALSSVPWTWKKILSRADEVWIAQEEGRNAYRKFGVPEEKIFCLPTGIDTTVFRTGLEPLSLPTKKIWKALFVAPLSYRKGWDHALAAFQASFRPTDDACLVIKISPSTSQDSRADFLADIKRAREHRSCPEILVLENEFSDEEMARLYASCQVFLAPHRASIHGTAALEAMACGLPVLATEDAGLDDCIRNRRGFPLPSAETVHHGALGNTLETPFWHEPHRESLARLLRYLFENPAIVRATAARAAEFAHRERNGNGVAKRAIERLQAVREGMTARKPGPPLVFISSHATEEGGGVFGELLRAISLDRSRHIVVASSSFQAPWDPVAKLQEILRAHPGCAGAAIEGTGGTIALLDTAAAAPLLEPLENFMTGAFVLELLRRIASSRDLVVEKHPELSFPATPEAVREQEAINRLTRAQRAFALGQAAEGFSELEKSLLAKPDYASALREGTQRFLDAGQSSEALRWAQKLIQAAPYWACAYYELGRVKEDTGQIALARDLFALANAMTPRHTEFLHHLGRSFQKLGERDKALRLYETAWALGLYEEGLACSYAKLLSESGKNYRAIEVLELCQRTHPGSFLARETLQEVREIGLQGKKVVATA